MAPPPPTTESLPPDPELRRLAAGLPEAVRFGTSSWNYPGWTGQVYHRAYPKTGASAAMLEEYVRFPLFRTVGIDSSFYGPPTPATLERYARALPPGFRCVSKVWDRITMQRFARARYTTEGGEPNPDFLNPDRFLAEVVEPYTRSFGDHLGPFVFEFQTIARSADITPLGFADRLDRFFGRLPREFDYAVELRNREFLAPA
ncbi:MAG TPA: DUF72 domain-containing protein, partial [Gemmatimonadales bacterium]|nr:DUF72 domain-containing protein [Gemmatimonadales bacterium]